MTAADDLYERGAKLRVHVLGRAHVERAQSRMTPLDEAFQTFVTRYVWGELWSRPGIEPKTRSLLTIAILATLGRAEELKLHLRGSRNTGVTTVEVQEALLQVAVYAGVPAGNSAFGAARETFQEIDAAAEGSKK